MLNLRNATSSETFNRCSRKYSTGHVRCSTDTISRFDDGMHDGRGDRFTGEVVTEVPPSCDDLICEDGDPEEEGTVFHESRIHFVLRQVLLSLREDVDDDTAQRAPPPLILPIMEDEILPASSSRSPSSRRRFLDAFCIASLDASLHDVTTSTSNGGGGEVPAADDGQRDMRMHDRSPSYMNTNSQKLFVSPALALLAPPYNEEATHRTKASCR